MKYKYIDWIDQAVACPVLKGIPQDELLDLLNQVNWQMRRYEAGDILAIQGDEVQSLFILLSGSVRGEMTDSSGNVVRIEDIHAPKPLAGAFLFGEKNFFPVDVIANEPVSVLVLPRAEFLKLLRLSPGIQINYLSLVSSKAQFLSERIKVLSFKTIKGKLAHYLFELPVETDGSCHIPQTQQAMSEYFGVARTSIARAIQEMEEEGAVNIKNRKVTILDPDLLRTYME